jgi:hypothetical protein
MENITQAETRTCTELEFVQPREEEDIRQSFALFYTLALTTTLNLSTTCFCAI